MEVISDIGAVISLLDDARRSDRSVGLVPTLGDLHRGHGSLIAEARRRDDVVAVSVFLNPLQFGDAADFAAYPRHLDADVAVAAEAGGDVVFAPSVLDFYPSGEPEVTIDPGSFGEMLEGASRPAHFRGVATVVAKLFSIFSPCRAYFGEKDYQQLLLVRRLSSALSMRVEVVACPTVREDDGLALSSRNARLSSGERRAAPVLYRALLAGRSRIASGGSAEEAEAEMAEVVGSQTHGELDYAVVRDAEALGPPASGPLRLLVAARFGSVRLIDNLAAPAPR